MIKLKQMFKPLTLISYADMATLFSASLGFLAITYIIDGSEKSYIVAMLILPFCAIIDGMDGALARKFGTKHHYGKYLDSISDSICFGIAPSILVYSLYYNLDRGPAIDIFDDDFQIHFSFFLFLYVCFQRIYHVCCQHILSVTLWHGGQTPIPHQ